MLIIQKLVVLLDEFHLNAFKQFLEDSKANLAKKLVDEVAKYGNNQPDSDVICKAIYGKSDEKAKKNFSYEIFFRFLIYKQFEHLKNCK